MRRQQTRMLAAWIVFAASCSVAHAVPLTDIIHLADGSTIVGRIVERLPGESYSIQTAEGKVVSCPAASVRMIEKGLDAEELPIQTRTVLYLVDGVIFRGMVVEETPQGAMTLELENGRLLRVVEGDAWKIGSEPVASTPGGRRQLAPAAARKTEIELHIELVQRELGETAKKSAALAAGSEQREGLEAEVSRLREELTGLDAERQRLQEQARREAERTARMAEEYADLQADLAEGDAELSRRIEACASAEARATLEDLQDALRAHVQQLFQKAEVASRLDAPDPRLVTATRAETKASMRAVIQNNLLSDRQHAGRFAELAATLTEQEKRLFYEETRRRDGLSAALLNIIPFVPIGSVRQGDPLGVGIGIASFVAGTAMALAGYSGFTGSGALDQVYLIAGGGIVAGAGYLFTLLRPISYMVWQNGRLARALGLDR
jgi:hypothetical protein